jgi:hypothetical protein
VVEEGKKGRKRSSFVYFPAPQQPASLCAVVPHKHTKHNGGKNAGLWLMTSVNRDKHRTRGRKHDQNHVCPERFVPRVLSLPCVHVYVSMCACILIREEERK